MGAFFHCFLQILLNTLGVFVLGGLLVELCYRLCFSLMGRRAGHTVWIATSVIGTPIHELGHAAMCLLFFHRIVRIRLWSTSDGIAMVEHSYNRRNFYATFGNLWISLGPIFSGLAVMFLTLYWVYPDTVSACFADARMLLSGEISLFPGLVRVIGGMIQGLFSEATHGIGWRLIALFVLLSTALHVRLSTADIRGMYTGVPGALILALLTAIVSAILGKAAVVGQAMRTFGGVVAGMFGLILFFALLQLCLILIVRALGTLGRLLFVGRRCA